MLFNLFQKLRYLFWVKPEELGIIIHMTTREIARDMRPLPDSYMVRTTFRIKRGESPDNSLLFFTIF